MVFQLFLLAVGFKEPTDIHQHSLSIDGDQTVVVSTVKQWAVHSGSSDSGSPPLVQLVTGTTCRLLFTTGKKCKASGCDYVRKQCFVAENWSMK